MNARRNPSLSLASILATALATTLAIGLTTPAVAITITATQSAATLANALVAGAGTGIVITGSNFSGHQQATFGPSELETSSGTYTNASATYGIGPGIVLTTGAVEERRLSFMDAEGMDVTQIYPGYGDGPNLETGNSTAYFEPGTANLKTATAEQEALLQPLSAYPHLDVTELVVNFDVQSGYDRVQFNLAYGTEEYDQFIGSEFIDIFAVFLNGTNIALVNGTKFNVDHPDFGAVTGTELNGLLAPGGNPLLTLSGAVNPGSNELRFIIADTQDSIYDSTVYLSGLKGVAVVPLPPGIWLLGTATVALFGRGYTRRRQRSADFT